MSEAIAVRLRSGKDQDIGMRNALMFLIKQ
jgi:hypothetical protein